MKNFYLPSNSTSGQSSNSQGTSSSNNAESSTARPPFTVPVNVSFHNSYQPTRISNSNFRPVQPVTMTATKTTSTAKTATTDVTANSTASGIRKPPLPKTRSKIVEPVTTPRTGLTEDQLRNMASTIRERSPSPSYSETQYSREEASS
jgi:hypothetical protein